MHPANIGKQMARAMHDLAASNRKYLVSDEGGARHLDPRIGVSINGEPGHVDPDGDWISQKDYAANVAYNRRHYRAVGHIKDGYL